jgi:cytochrome P450
VDVDFHDRRIVADPFPTFELIRAEGRVVWNELMQLWMVPGYHDNIELLSDWRRFSNSILHEPSFSAFVIGDSMLNTDPPRASELRRIQQKPFTRQAMARIQPRITEIVDGFLDQFVRKLEDGAVVDLVGDYLRGIPTMVICEMMGIPEEHRLDVQRWTDDMIAGLRAGTDEAALTRRRISAEAGEHLNALFLAERAKRHRQPTDDVLTRLASSHEGFGDNEYLAACQLLISAGNETTFKAAANAIVLLARHPGQRRLLVDEPALLATAVAEVLRYEGVPQASPRRVMLDTELAGVKLKKGQEVVALLVAGNRDPAKFRDPGRFDVRRHPNPHLAFAYGTHLCLGANLARMEMQTMIGRLLQRVPEWEVTSVDYGESFHVRGPSYVGFTGTPVRVGV